MKNNLLLQLVFFLALLPSAKMWSQNYTLFWSDEFSGSSLDQTYWSYETGNGEWGWGTGQLDYATDRDTNVHVRGGNLTIQTLKDTTFMGKNFWGTMQNFDYTSGRLLTAKKLSVKYGKIEMRAKVPTGQGTGVAFWMLPTWEKFGGWPRSGEIDILEICGNKTTQAQGTVHFGENGNDATSHGIYTPPPGQDFSTDFHVFGIEWDANAIKWYVDDSIYKQIDISVPYGNQYYFPFAEEFYLIVSGGVGASFCGTTVGDDFPNKYVVDYVRIYKKSDEIVSIPGKIQAEAYTSEKSTQMEPCTDVDGGYDVGQIATGDFLSYHLIAQDAGVYKTTFRVAAGTGYSGSIKIMSGGAQVGTINVPTTGGWQKWQDVTVNITLKKGVQNITLDFTGTFNLNYVNYELLPDFINEVKADAVNVFPNPFSSEINIVSDSEGMLKVYDLSGREVLYSNFMRGSAVYSTSHLATGLYVVEIKTNNAVNRVKLVKE